MGIKAKSTKSFKNLACAHSQWFALAANGEPGECAAIHGYDREVIFTFCGEVDEHGWIFPFGALRDVKDFLEFYFDHTTVLGADDPRIGQITPAMQEPGQFFATLRILPYGASMEMSSLFVWEHVNPYIYHTSQGRVYLEKVEMREHDRNSAMIEVDEASAKKQAQSRMKTQAFLIKQKAFAYIKPQEAMVLLG